MPTAGDTSWTLVKDAAEDIDGARSRFYRQYASPVRAYLGARWRASPLRGEVEDACQEVFLECFRGALARARGGNDGRFRPFLYGIARNVARRFEERRALPGDRREAPPGALQSVPSREENPSLVFDREWALGLLREARAAMAARAGRGDEAALRRVEILRLRFQEDRPIREIAKEWGADPEHLHREYARAREEFREALEEVLYRQHPGAADEVARECAHLALLFRRT